MSCCSFSNTWASTNVDIIQGYVTWETFTILYLKHNLEA